MLKAYKTFRGVLALFMLLCILFIGTLMAIYFMNPTGTIEKASEMFAPTVNIKSEYLNKTSLEAPIVYELMHVIGSQTKISQNSNNLLNKNTAYSAEVEQHFSGLSDHAAVKFFNRSLSNNGSFIPYMAVKILALNYDLDDDNNLIKTNEILVKPWLLRLAATRLFTIEAKRAVIEDFAKQSDFKSFYDDHSDYYASLKDNHNTLVDLEGSKTWLEAKFPNSYDSERIIFSPLTGGSHSTMALQDKKQEKEQMFMFVSGPPEDLSGMTDEEFEVESSWQTRIVFTEINHNYVNPLSGKYLEKIEAAIPDYTFWNKQEENRSSTSYDSAYKTFNEYMTWGVFSLYATEIYSPDNLDAIMDKHTGFMSRPKQRSFVRFTEFNDELLRLYEEGNQPMVEELYEPMLDWMKTEYDREANQ